MWHHPLKVAHISSNILKQILAGQGSSVCTWVSSLAFFITTTWWFSSVCACVCVWCVLFIVGCWAAFLAFTHLMLLAYLPTPVVATTCASRPCHMSLGDGEVQMGVRMGGWRWQDYPAENHWHRLRSSYTYCPRKVINSTVPSLSKVTQFGRQMP